VDAGLNDYSPTLGETFADAKRRIDFNDLQSELAGLDTGRARRFLTERQYEERRSAHSGERRAESLSRLQLLLATNPRYVALYLDTFDALRGAEDATERAMAKAAEALERAQRKLQETLDRAARLPDGTRVFKDRNGQVWSEHGVRVSEVDAASIVWRGDEPTREEFTADKAAVGTITRVTNELRVNQADLGQIREQMTDEGNPADEAGLAEMRRRADGYRQRAEQTLSTVLNEPAPTPATARLLPNATAQLEIPTL
jgi:hypothetical protein